MALQEKHIKLHNTMKPVTTPTITPSTISVPPSSPSTPHVTSSLSTVIVFASVIASLLLLGLYCSFTRRRSISDARDHLVDQLRIRTIIPSTDMHRPANVSLPVRKYTQEEMGMNGKETEECPVCLVEFEEDEEVKVVDPGCEHIFHPVCIDRWLAMRDTCPVCRSAIVGDETEWSEVWIEGEEWDAGANANMETITELRDDGAGEEGEVVMNVENVAVSEEGNGCEGCDGEVVISVEGEGAERGEGEEEEVVVYVESVVLSEAMGVRMNVERGSKGREMEMKVNIERDTGGEEGELRVTMEKVGMNALEVDDTGEKL